MGNPKRIRRSQGATATKATMDTAQEFAQRHETFVDGFNALLDQIDAETGTVFPLRFKSTFRRSKQARKRKTVTA